MIIQHYPHVSMEFSGSRGRASDRDLERQMRKKEWYRKRRANMTSEQLDAERAHQREYERKRRVNMAPEQLDALRAYRRQYARKRRWRARAAKATLEN